jgi:hypothetical protein
MLIYRIPIHDFMFWSVLCYESICRFSVSLFYGPEIDDSVLHKF